MQLKKTVELIAQYITRFFVEKFSGKVVFTFHFQQGGVGKTEVEIKHDLEKWYKDSQKDVDNAAGM